MFRLRLPNVHYLPALIITFIYIQLCSDSGLPNVHYLPGLYSYISFNIIYSGMFNTSFLWGQSLHISVLSSRGNPLSTPDTMPLRGTCRRRRRSISSCGNAGELFYCVVQGGDSSGLQCREQTLTDSPSEAEWRAEPQPWITVAGEFH